MRVSTNSSPGRFHRPANATGASTVTSRPRSNAPANNTFLFMADLRTVPERQLPCHGRAQAKCLAAKTSLDCYVFDAGSLRSIANNCVIAKS
jgi:hypothetical protein